MRDARNIGAQTPDDQLNNCVLDVGELVAKLHELVDPFFEKLTPLFRCAHDSTQKTKFYVWRKDFACLADMIGYHVVLNIKIETQKGGFVAD